MADTPKQRRSMSPARGKENISIPGTTSKAAGGVGPRSGKKTPTFRRIIPSASSTPSSRVGLATSSTPADRWKPTASSSIVEPIRQGADRSNRQSNPGGGGMSHNAASTSASRGQKGQGARSRAMTEVVGKRSVRKIILSTPVSEPSGRAAPRRKGAGKTGRGGVKNSAHGAKRVTATRANQGVGKGRPEPDEVAVTARGWCKQASHADEDPSEVFSFDVEVENDDKPRASLQNDGGIGEQKSIKGENQAFLCPVAANASQVPRGRSSNAGGRRKKTASVSRKGDSLAGIDAKRSARTKRKISAVGAGVRKTGNHGAAQSAVAKLPSKQGGDDDPRVLLAVPAAAEQPLAVPPRTNDSSLLGHAEPSRGWGQLRALFGDSDEEEQRKSRNAALWRLSDEEDGVDLKAESRTRSVRKSWGTTDGVRGLRRARGGGRRSTGGLPDESISQGKSVKRCGEAPSGRRAFEAADGQHGQGGHRDCAGGEVGVRSSTAADPEGSAASPSERGNARGRRSDWKRMSKTDQEQLEALAAYYREVDSFPLIVSS